jgi:N-acetylneuraminic acid mutarotase
VNGGSSVQAERSRSLPNIGLLLVLILAAAAHAQGKVTPAGHLAVARMNHTATRLADGRVLVVGGRGTDGLTALASTELFDPKTSKRSLGPPLSVGRTLHTATLLADGRVLVVGGITHESKDGQNRFVALASAELFDPKTNAWKPTGALADARNGHTATLLTDGRVLVVGGAREQRQHLASVELYDPEKEAFVPRRPLALARWMHVAARLSDGSVVVLGGRSNMPEGKGSGVAIASSERYDASSGVWHPVPELNEARQRTAFLAQDDVVTVVGGQTTSSSTNYVESWKPGADAWEPAKNHLTMALAGHSATLLSNGDLLVIGGEPPNEVDTSRVQRLDKATQGWCLAGTLASSRKGHTATLLGDGRVLVVGGTSAGMPDPTAELWSPASGKCEEPPGLSLDW